MTDFPSPGMRLFLAFWALLWAVALPAILLYLYLRARGDALYGRDLAQRFGIYPHRWQGSTWVHAVSIGEFRSAVPLIRRLLQQGERVVITHFTPAARRDIAKVFAEDIAREQLAAVWVPLEFHWAYRRFFAAYRPRLGLVMEVEYWPRMIASARRCGVPLFLCNGQYPSRSYARDRHRLRGQLVRGFAGVMVKDKTQADRFLALGLRPEAIAMTGEMRFDQPVPWHLVEAAEALQPEWPGAHPAITFASAVEGEDETYLQTIAQLRQQAEVSGTPLPRIIYVPRAPERFDEVAGMLAAEGWQVTRRSEAFDDRLTPQIDLSGTEILLGDSMGEMYFYLALGQACVVGGGFTEKGAHNVIEPLALCKPVFVGPTIWTIEYPAFEAIEAGVLTVCGTAGALAAALSPSAETASPAQMQAFFAEHSGGVERTFAALPRLLDHARTQGIG